MKMIAHVKGIVEVKRVPRDVKQHVFYMVDFLAPKPGAMSDDLTYKELDDITVIMIAVDNTTGVTTFIPRIFDFHFKIVVVCKGIVFAQGKVHPRLSTIREYAIYIFIVDLIDRLDL